MARNQNILSFNYFRLQKVRRRLKQVNRWQKKMRDCSDTELQQQTKDYQARIQAGESLDDLLPEAFATMREAAYRILGMFAYDEQILGGIVMHQGQVAEMLTGEGKTLTALFPLYLHALSGKGAMLVTANEYLAVRDGKEMSPVFRWLGLTTAIGVKEDSKEPDFTAVQKKNIYSADVVYTTYSTLGFDYLIENLASEQEDQYMRPLNFVIIDEIDSVLLDSAQMPLIISGSPRVQSNLYQLSDQFVRMLEEGPDFRLDEERESVWLTGRGIQQAEEYFQIDNLYQSKYSELNRHILLALKAHHLFEEHRKYIIDQGEITLLNESSGRSLPGTRLQAGQHQAIETKESVKLTQEKRAMASITYQNLFKKFNRMSGMSGTVKVSEQEFNEVYGMEVIAVPTHRPVQRIDYPDRIYPNLEEKILASVKLLEEEHRTGRPILLAVGSVDMSRLYSNILLQKGIPHNVLNAYHIAKEAEIIAMAGHKDAVTIATPMAGRGTDIKLGPGVAELGGLLVIGTEKMVSQRIDLQLRGRSGRQGDPGASVFFASLEDDLIQKWGLVSDKILSRNIQRMSRFKRGKYQRLLNQAQAASDSHAKEIRQQATYMDESLSLQRDMIYREREILLNEDHPIPSHQLQAMAEQVFLNFLENSVINRQTVQNFIASHLTYEWLDLADEIDFSDQLSVKNYLIEIFQSELTKKRKDLKSDHEYHDFVRKALLKAIDVGWIEQVDYLQQFKQVVGTRQLAQKNILYEYHSEALKSYEWMCDYIYQKAVRYLCLSYIDTNPLGEIVVHFA
ncbi:accessory Sec system translocase SecA2 [Ignavigranum ruoffiae]|uniref:accessory Sec system translocase SecA2 n=1 Tax=Ignavigranum ruoffiae TaxID=89093 RepID=UPI003AFF68D1